MRKLSLFAAMVAGLLAYPALADWTGKDAGGSTITFANPGTCTSVVCVPLSAPYALASVGTGWTSATSLNTTQSVMAAGYGAPAVLVQLNQTSTLTGGAITFQGTYDGTNWVSVPVAQLINPNTFAPLANPYTLVASTNQPFLILTQGYQQIRLNLTTVITGTATVTPQVTLLPYNPAVGALLNPLSAGTAIIGKVGIDQSIPGTTNLVSAGQSGNWTTRVVGSAGAVFDFVGQNAASPANALLHGCQFNTSPTTITSGNASPCQVDNAGNLKVNIIAGASSGAVAQGSTTSGQTGGLVQGAVTTAPPSYSNATTNPLSIAPDGSLRVNNTGPYPIGAVPYTASATGTTAATTATLTGAASVTTFICGFSIRANATAAATGNATVTGTITATLNFTQWTAPAASGLGITEMIFSPCVPASAANTSVAVVSAAPGTGGVVSVTAWGYKL